MAREKAQRDKNFMANLIKIFMNVLSSIPDKGACTMLLDCSTCIYVAAGIEFCWITRGRALKLQ